MCISVRRAWAASVLAVAIVLGLAAALFIRGSPVDFDREDAVRPEDPSESHADADEIEPLDVNGRAVNRDVVNTNTSEETRTTTEASAARFGLKGPLRLPDGAPLAKLTLVIRRDVPSDETELDSVATTEFVCTTGENGEFVFPDLPPGRYRPTLPRQKELAIEPAWIDFAGDMFVEWTVDAHLLVVEAVTAASQPVERAIVQATVSRRARDDVTKTETLDLQFATDARGIASFLVDRPCSVDVLARSGALEGREIGVMLSSNPRAVKLTVVLAPPLQPGAMQIRFTNQLGDEVRVFRVRLHDRETGGSFHSVGPENLDAAGWISGLLPGEYEVELARSYTLLEPEFYIDSDRLEKRVVVSSGQVAPVHFRVIEGGRIRVRCDDVGASAESNVVVEVNARPYDGGADVRLWFLSGDEQSMTASRSLVVNERRLAQQALPAGRYVLTVQSDHHEPVTADCVVDVGQIEDIDFVLRRRAN